MLGGTCNSNNELLPRLDAAIAAKNLLNHPFYIRIGRPANSPARLSSCTPPSITATSKLSPRTCASWQPAPTAACARSWKKILLKKKIPDGSHPKLWRDFAAALGVQEDDIKFCPALPGTQAVVQTYREICGDRSVAEAVAALYAYESQVPEIATTKIEGLRTFYGINTPEALAYFTVHEAADKAHRAAWRSWLEQNAGDNTDEIMATTGQALDALWGALDAVPAPWAAPKTNRGAVLHLLLPTI